MPRNTARRHPRGRQNTRGRSRRSGPARASRRASARARDFRDDARETFGRLEQRHLDVIGLGLIALAVYLGFVLHAGWDGGKVGEWTKTGLTHAVGRVSYAIPIALAGWAAALIMRPMIKAPAAVNAGGVLVLAGLLLAFAAQTAGLGPEHPVRHESFDSRFYAEHGGAAGEGLYWAATTLFQRLGAHILAVLMLVSGALLLTGVTISGLLAGMGRAARRAHDGTRDLAQTARTIREENAPEAWGAGEEISITRANPTEPLVTEALAAEDDEAHADGPKWEGVETDERGEIEVGITRADRSDDDAEAARSDERRATSDESSEQTPMGEARGVTASEEVDYRMPEAKLLGRGKADPGPDTRDREAVAKALLEALAHFGVEARLVGTVSGPHVSRYELQLAPGTKVGAIAKLKDDLAYALASTEIRILAPIPGKKAVGVEVPNQRRRLVRLGDIYAGRPRGSSPLTVWLGKDVSGHAISTDLAPMPHALVAGTTGSGKSGCINTMLCSALMGASPNELRLVLVDPKRVELNHYERLPHLLTPVVTNPRLAATVLANLIGEMETRYAVMGEARARNLAELNKVRKRTGEPTLPHILCVIDELADLMMVAPAEVEDSIIRLAQKSRAVGIHLVLATQRPSTDVITGTIKVNIPARIAFAVASQVDSRVILDGGGAESLLGQGDMLFRPVGTSRLQRIQGAFVTEEEIGRLTSHWSRQGEPEFDKELLEARTDPAEEGDEDFSPDQDDLLEDAARIVVQSDTASVSMLQRRLRVGYTRAGRLIDMLERRGIISGYEGSKPRQVLVGAGDLERVLGGGEPAAGEDPGEGDDGPPTETEMEPVGG